MGASEPVLIDDLIFFSAAGWRWLRWLWLENIPCKGKDQASMITAENKLTSAGWLELKELPKFNLVMSFIDYCLTYSRGQIHQPWYLLN